jgi:hypothetical protein
MLKELDEVFVSLKYTFESRATLTTTRINLCIFYKLRHTKNRQHFLPKRWYLSTDFSGFFPQA